MSSRRTVVGVLWTLRGPAPVTDVGSGFWRRKRVEVQRTDPHADQIRVPVRTNDEDASAQGGARFSRGPLRRRVVRVRRIASTAGFVLAALAVVLLTQSLWSIALAVNLGASPALPWSVPIAAVLLVTAWQYLSGRWGPRSTQPLRRRYLRASVLPRGRFAVALLAGFFMLVALIALWLVLTQLLPMPTTARVDLASYPPLTVAAVIIMASLLGAIVEEVGIRGYMLSRLQEVLPTPLAIAAVAIIIVPGHGFTQGFALPVVLWYLVADVALGTLVARCGSIRPAIVVHALGLVVFFTVIWPTDSARAAAYLGSGNAALWLEVATCVLFGSLATVAFSRLESPPVLLSNSVRVDPGRIRVNATVLSVDAVTGVAS